MILMTRLSSIAMNRLSRVVMMMLSTVLMVLGGPAVKSNVTRQGIEP